jgi:alpha-tubulin suppressor-like RCC1 family protein
MSVLGGHQFKNLSVMADTVIAVDYSNYAWAWGTVTTGQLGNGAATNRSSPVSVIGDRQFAVPPANVAELASKNVGAAFVILDTSGFAWSWGRNLEGQLGDGTVTNRSSPVSVLGGNQFKSLMLQDRIVGAVDKNNAVWTWGVNDMGQLGDGTLVGRSSPVSVVRVML